MSQQADIPQEVIDFLASERTMTLATATPGGIPHATTLLYVSEGPSMYFWSRSNSTAARQVEQNPVVAFTVHSYAGDLHAARGVQGTGECSVILDGTEIARVADLFGQQFPDLQPGSTMSISFFRIAPTELQFIDSSDGAAGDAFGAEFRKKHSYSVLAALPHEQVESVDAKMRSEQHQAGEVIFREGAPADKFMVIVEGEVEVLRGDEPAGEMGPGHFFGETSALRDTPRLATVRAKTDVTVMALDGDAFRGIVAQALGTTADFNDIIAKRLESPGA
jgi:uncharacterized protein YhbP (UPF0306 family)